MISSIGILSFDNAFAQSAKMTINVSAVGGKNISVNGNTETNNAEVMYTVKDPSKT